jgi:ribosome recycling factor
MVMPLSALHVIISICISNFEAFDMGPSAIASIPALKDVYQQLKTRMDKAVEDFRTNLAAARTGRASVHMLDTVRVPYYGSEMPLNQVAQVHAADAQLLTVTPYDPSILAEIDKAIRSAGLGLNPQNDGKMIRIPVPPLTEERRREMVKNLHKILEDHRTAIRNVRRDGNDAVKKAMKDKKITEDDEKKALDEVQKLTDAEIKKMEEMSAAKEKELMTV